MRRTGNRSGGLLLIVLGVLFLLHNMHMLDFGQAVREYWPAILILWGVSILLSRSRVSTASSDGGAAPPPSPAAGVRDVFNDRSDSPAADRIGYSTVFGDLSIRPLSANFKGGTVSTVFGDTAIDLTSATLADGENKLTLSGVFGDVRIMLAPTMSYAISANSLFGAIQAAGQKRDGFSSTLTLQSPEYSTTPKRLSIEVSQVFGDITMTR
jgi:hypothetical protein